MSLGWASMPVRHVRHSRPEAHRELAKKSLEDREILGHGCGIYPRISRALRLIRGVGGTRGRLLELDPTWAANGVAKHRTRRGSTWVDHVRSEWHVTRAGVTWDFRGGGRTTCRGKSRGDGWDRYTRYKFTRGAYGRYGDRSHHCFKASPTFFFDRMVNNDRSPCMAPLLQATWLEVTPPSSGRCNSLELHLLYAQRRIKISIRYRYHNC